MQHTWGEDWQDFTTHPPPSSSPNPNDISLSGRALQANAASDHSPLLLCFKSMGSNTCSYQQHWEFSCHCKTSCGTCEKAQKKRIFTAAVRAIGFVKLGSRDTWTPVPSCPKHSSPASPLCNLIPRRNEDDQLHPYFCGKESELHEHTATMIPAWTQKIKIYL